MMSQSHDSTYRYETMRYFETAPLGAETDPPDHRMTCIECGTSIETWERCADCGDIPQEFDPCAACRCTCEEEEE